MRTGINYSAHNRYSYSDAYQRSKIPSGAASATLGINLYQYSTEVTTLAEAEAPTASQLSTLTEAGDVQYILLLDWYGNWIDTLYWKRKNTQAWNFHQMNDNVWNDIEQGNMHRAKTRMRRLTQRASPGLLAQRAPDRLASSSSSSRVLINAL